MKKRLTLMLVALFVAVSMAAQGSYVELSEAKKASEFAKAIKLFNKNGKAAAFQSFQLLANHEYGPAEYVLSQYYEYGYKGVQKDPEKAKQYLESAAKKGVFFAVLRYDEVYKKPVREVENYKLDPDASEEEKRLAQQLDKTVQILHQIQSEYELISLKRSYLIRLPLYGKKNKIRKEAVNYFYTTLFFEPENYNYLSSMEWSIQLAKPSFKPKARLMDGDFWVTRAKMEAQTQELDAHLSHIMHEGALLGDKLRTLREERLAKQK